jgi:hypothetical protein
MNSISAALDAARMAYTGSRPADGDTPLHSQIPVMKKSIVRERELLVQRTPQSVIRSGRFYIYTMPNGERYHSYVAPEIIQWQPGPGAPC